MLLLNDKVEIVNELNKDIFGKLLTICDPYKLLAVKDQSDPTVQKQVSFLKQKTFLDILL